MTRGAFQHGTATPPTPPSGPCGGRELRPDPAARRPSAATLCGSGASTALGSDREARERGRGAESSSVSGAPGCGGRTVGQQEELGRRAAEGHDSDAAKAASGGPSRVRGLQRGAGPCQIRAFGWARVGPWQGRGRGPGNVCGARGGRVPGQEAGSPSPGRRGPHSPTAFWQLKIVKPPCMQAARSRCCWRGCHLSLHTPPCVGRSANGCSMFRVSHRRTCSS